MVTKLSVLVKPCRESTLLRNICAIFTHNGNHRARICQTLLVEYHTQEQALCNHRPSMCQTLLIGYHTREHALFSPSVVTKSPVLCAPDVPLNVPCTRAVPLRYWAYFGRVYADHVVTLFDGSVEVTKSTLSIFGILPLKFRNFRCVEYATVYNYLD